MSWSLSVNLLPGLSPDEKVVSVRKWIWAASGKSLPSYRVFFCLPPIQEAGVYVTDKRILIVFYLFRIMEFEMSIWFPGLMASSDTDFIQTVALGKMPVFGRYIEITSENPISHWYHSRRLRMRLFVSDPESLLNTIRQQAGI